MAVKKNKRGKKKLQKVARPDLKAATRVGVWVGVALLIVVAARIGVLKLWGMLRDAPSCQVSLRNDVVLPDWPDCVVAEHVETAVAERLKHAELPNMSIVSRSGGRTPAQLVHEALKGAWWFKSLDAVRTEMPSASNNWKPRIIVDATPYQAAAVVHWHNPVLGGGNRQIIDRDGRWLGEEFDLYMLPKSHYKLSDSMSEPHTPFIVDDRDHIPTPQPGKPWNHMRFAVGARLYTLLYEGGLFENLDVTKIDVMHVGQGSRAPVSDGSTRPDITLGTAGGAVIKWGCTDAYDDVEGLHLPPDEPSDADKLNRLIEVVRINPHLPDHRYVDLRFRITDLAPRIIAPE